MIMIPGTGTISNYGSYINNCQARQMPYRIPVNNLLDVQLYINIGATKPDTIEYQLIHTCGPNAGVIETLTTSSYIVAQDTNGNWYGVFKNFNETTNPLTCFVIAITLTNGETDNIYFSEEYCVEDICGALQLVYIGGCYGNPDNKISYDCNGIYFGTANGAYSGDPTIVYKHQLLLRSVEVYRSAIKNTFKQGRTRNFRTEKEKIYQFNAELVPAWYIDEIDAVFYRGEVYIGETKYLVNETAFELIEECKKIWKPAATFKESCLQSFTCEVDPCLPLVAVCCEPVVISAGVEEVPDESGSGDVESDVVIARGPIDEPPVVTGTLSPVTGWVNGSFVVTCDAFIGHHLIIERGYIPIYDTNPLDGGTYYTKVLMDNFITFSHALTAGEFLYIRTIP